MAPPVPTLTHTQNRGRAATGSRASISTTSTRHCACCLSSQPRKSNEGRGASSRRNLLRARTFFPVTRHHAARSASAGACLAAISVSRAADTRTKRALTAGPPAIVSSARWNRSGMCSTCRCAPVSAGNGYSTHALQAASCATSNDARPHPAPSSTTNQPDARPSGASVSVILVPSPHPQQRARFNRADVYQTPAAAYPSVSVFSSRCLLPCR